MLAALTAALVLFFTAGVDIGAAWMVSRRQWQERSAFATSQLAAVVLGLLGLGVGIGLYAAGTSTTFRGIGIAPLATALLALPAALMWTYVSQIAFAAERYEHSTLVAIVQSIVGTTAIAAFAWLAGLQGAAAGILAGHCAAALAARRITRTGRKRTVGLINLRRLWAASAFGLKAYAANALSFVMFRADLFVLSGYAGAREVGYYAVATALTGSLLLVPFALSGALFPRVAALSATPQDSEALQASETRTLRHTTLATLTGMVVLAVILLLLLKPIYGAGFGPAATPGLILLPGVAALALASSLYAGLTGRGHPGYALASALLLTPATLVLYFTLIPRFGATGAAVGSSLAYVGDAVLGAVFLRRATQAPVLGRLLPRRAEVADYLALLRTLRLRLLGCLGGAEDKGGLSH